MPSPGEGEACASPLWFLVCETVVFRSDGREGSSYNGDGFMREAAELGSVLDLGRCSVPDLNIERRTNSIPVPVMASTIERRDNAPENPQKTARACG